MLGEIDWRLAFVTPAAVAVVLAFVPPPDADRIAGAEPARLRAVLTRRVGVLSAAAFAGYAGVTSLGFLVALRAADGFGLGSSARGAVLAGFGVAGMVTGRPAGRLVDRFGRVSVTVAGALICAVLVGLIGAAGTIEGLTLLWLAAGAASSLIWAGLNTLTIEAVPANRAGATSVVSAFKFAGNAAAPAMWLPLYANDVRLAFVAAGGASALVGALALRAALSAWALRFPPMLTITGIDELKAKVGEELGASEWREVTQADIDAFAEATGDHQWIHVDPERAAQSPFGSTIAHGLYTLGLGPVLTYEVYEIEGFAFGVNYGYDRVRFPAPLPVDSRVRMRATLESVDDVPGGVQIKVTQTFEREGGEKPVCVAEQLVRLYTGG